MDINLLISKIEEQYNDETPGSFTAETRFKDLAEWGSLTALFIVAMVDQDFGKKLTGDIIESSNTIQDIYNHLNKQS